MFARIGIMLALNRHVDRVFIRQVLVVPPSATSSFAPFLVPKRTSCSHKLFTFGSPGHEFAAPPIAGKVRA